MLWLAKIASKIALARLPFAYGVWQRLGLFRHGAMDTSSYALRVFDRHMQRLGPKPREALVALELGPGDSAASALLAAAHGFRHTYLVDAGDFAVKDVAVYAQLAAGFSRAGLTMPVDLDLTSFDGFLRTCRATYLTAGIDSLKALPDASVDFVWSQAVLEHVPLSEFLPTMRELHRVLKPDGVVSHRVDLKDHLAGALNNLRFSQATWESPLFRRSGFYTNRIRFQPMLDLFAQAGFAVRDLTVERWKALPTPRTRMADPFRSMDPDALLVSGFDVVLTKGHGPVESPA
jgi:SAM-dependent methyltransferase